MGLNAAQKRAVEYLAGPLLVLAGPGTGKTQLLSEKVAYILKNTDTNPENILCLTFTESGAANMRERLRGLIKNDALKVNISTYHAFGSEILAEYRHYAEDYERRLDVALDEVARFKIVRELQEKLPARDILKGDSVKDIVSVISEAKSAGLSAADLALVAEQNQADAEILGRAISPLLGKVVPRMYKESLERAYRPIYDLLAKYQETQPIVKNIERSIAGLARDLAVAFGEAEATQKIKPLSNWKDKYFEKDEKGRYRLRDRIANKKLASIAKLMEKYQTYLAKNGLFDFDDMIEEAVRVLKNDRGFRLTLEERYQFLMLDEFQDTNPSQFAIVKALTDYEQPMIMAVGDDDQAIYEFQGALSSNLTDFREHYKAEVITLTENYRSTQEILDFAREIIRQAPDRFADKKLVAQAKNPVKTQIYRNEFMSSDQEYAFVAGKIAGLVEAGVKQSEIAVISYKTKYFEPLLPYLKACPRIKIAYEKRDDLLANEEIHEILTMLRYASDLAARRRPSVQLMEILTYPQFGLPALEVLKLAYRARQEHRSMFEALAEANEADYRSASKMRAAAVWLAELAKSSLTRPLEKVIGEMTERMAPVVEREATKERRRNGKNMYADDDISERVNFAVFSFYENLAALMGKLRRHVGEKPLRVADLLAMVDDYETADMQLTATSPYRDADDAVQILTAHRAKGLEFSYVFIISADHTAWGKGKGNNNLLTLPKNMQQIRHTGITDSERLRVLYVALTRAKQFLWITNSLHDFNGKSPDRLEYLQEYVEVKEGEEHVISSFLPAGEVKLCYEAAAVGERTENLRNWLAAYRPDSPELAALYRERVEGWRMSASALTSFIDIAYAGPEIFFRNYLLRAPREPDTVALALGDLIHQTFEAVTKEQLGDEAAMEFYKARLAERDLEPLDFAQVEAKGEASLQAALSDFGQILRTGEAEVDFRSERLVVQGVPVTGKIDHLMVDEANKTITIYDFKTGGYHKEKWQSHATLYKYMLQLGFYKLLLNHSPRFSKYQVREAHILFVSPDRDEMVHDKVYEFNASDERELVRLMQAVYGQVSTLKFVNDPELMVSPQKGRNLKDIREFIKLMLAKSGQK